MPGRMPPFRGMFEFESVNPRKRRGKTTEVEMVFNRKNIAAMGVNGPDVLLDFLESTFDFPSCGIKLNHLLGGKKNVCSNQRKTETFTVNEYVEQTCDYVSIIHRGRKVCEEKASDLMKRHESIEILSLDGDAAAQLIGRESLKLLSSENADGLMRFLVEGSESLIPYLAEKMVNTKIRIAGISKHQKVLEGIFVELTGSEKNIGSDEL